MKEGLELYMDETDGANGGTWNKVTEFIDNNTDGFWMKKASIREIVPNSSGPTPTPNSILISNYNSSIMKKICDWYHRTVDSITQIFFMFQ